MQSYQCSKYDATSLQAMRTISNIFEKIELLLPSEQSIEQYAEHFQLILRQMCIVIMGKIPISMILEKKKKKKKMTLFVWQFVLGDIFRNTLYY